MDLKNNKKIVVSLLDSSVEMMKKIKNKQGHLTNAETIRNAIAVYYSKVFKDYVEIKSMKSADVEESAERKLMIEEEKDKLKKAREEKKWMEIVESLGGKVETRRDGERICRYVVHQLRADYEQEIPLSQLTPDLKNYQWVPDKKTVLEFRKKHNK